MQKKKYIVFFRSKLIFLRQPYVFCLKKKNKKIKSRVPRPRRRVTAVQWQVINSVYQRPDASQLPFLWAAIFLLDVSWTRQMFFYINYVGMAGCLKYKRLLCIHLLCKVFFFFYLVSVIYWQQMTIGLSYWGHYKNSLGEIGALRGEAWSAAWTSGDSLQHALKEGEIFFLFLFFALFELPRVCTGESAMPDRNRSHTLWYVLTCLGMLCY